jgi:uncharacterized membrane protein
MTDPVTNTTEPVPVVMPQAWALWSMRLVAVVGLGLSLFLFWPWLSGRPMPGCGATDSGFACGSILVSRWASLFGMPVSALAMLLYAGALVASRHAVPGRSPRQQTNAYEALVALAVMALGAGLWFGATMLFEKQGCKYCLAAHGCGLLFAALVGYWALRRRAAARLQVASSSFIASKSHFFTGLGGVAILIIGQLIYASPTVIAIEIDGREDIDTGPGPNRTITFLSRRITKLRPHELPMLGSPDAKHILVSLFDYTCLGCQARHGQLKTALERFGDQVGVILLPYPRDGKCNKMMPANDSGACYKAQLGLAVWYTRPELFTEFDDWVYADDDPPTSVQMRSRAVGLIGEPALRQGLDDPRNRELINMSVDVFATVNRMRRYIGVPLLLGQRMIVEGQFKDAEELIAMLEQTLGIVATAAPTPKGVVAKPSGAPTSVKEIRP